MDNEASPSDKDKFHFFISFLGMLDVHQSYACFYFEIHQLSSLSNLVT